MTQGRKTQNNEYGLAMLCVTCPNRPDGLCRTLTDLLSRPSSPRRPGVSHRFAAFAAGEGITRRNEIPDRVLIVCAGWVFRYFELHDGRRQILRFLMPGDLVSIGPLAGRINYSTTALTRVHVSSFDCQDLLTGGRASAEFRERLVAAAVDEIRAASELSVILGQRSAEERIAYLFLDLTRRIAQGTVIRDQRYAVPLLRQHIADALGLTAVHVSRVLGAFRERGICDLSEGVLSVFASPELERIGTIG